MAVMKAHTLKAAQEVQREVQCQMLSKASDTLAQSAGKANKA